MKRTFNTYLATILVLLLGTFATLKAEGLFSNIEDVFDHTQHTKSFISELSNTKADLNPIQDKGNQHSAFDIVDSEEVENEESSSNNSNDNKELSTAFINAKVFDSFSKELQKHILRVPRNAKTPKTRLHLLHQVFII